MEQKIDLSRFLQTFVTEARERLDLFERGVMSLESDPSAPETIKELLREAHTIKGSARMVGQERIDELAHRTENVLVALRDHAHIADRRVVDGLLAATDGMRALIAEAAGEQAVGTCDLPALCQRLDHLFEGGDEPQPAPRATVTRIRQPEPRPAPAARRAEPVPVEADRRALQRTVRVSMGKLEQLANLTLDLSINREQEEGMAAKLYDLLVELRRCQRGLGYLLGRMAVHARQLNMHDGALAQEASELRQEVEVLSNDLDRVVHTGSTLWHNRNALRRRDTLLAEELQSLVGELQLVPISTIFDTLPRALRDLAQEYGREVQLQVEGADTQLDKKIAEEIGEPLLHLVRNAVGHGIEAPEVRLRAGKPRRGTVRLSARAVGDRIQIAVADDGAGIDPAAVRARAIERGLVSAEEAAALPDDKACNLIFAPGLSTARTITDVSGRGVGMDIVDATARRLNGSVTIANRPGQGATFTIDLPLSIAVMEVVLVRVARSLFALPTSFIHQVTRIARGQLEQAQGGPVVRLESGTVRVAELAAATGLACKGWNGVPRPLVVVGAGGDQLGFLVDEVIGENRVVVKSLASCPLRLHLVMAATVGPLGEVVPILDVAGLIESAGAPAAEVTARPEHQERVPAILVVDDSVVTNDLVRNLLETAGYRVSVAYNGLEALGLLGKRKFDLVVTDIEMPRLDGFGLLERMRADPATREVPVIIVTSRHAPADQQRGLELGAQAYILKDSFSQATLLETVGALVE